LTEFENYLLFLSDTANKLRIPLIVSGDFNINLLQVDSNLKVSDFVNCVYSHSLFPSIYRPTRITSKSATLIDNIFVSDPNFYSSGLLTVDISDHLPIFTFCHVPNRAKDRPSNIVSNTYIKSKTNFYKVCRSLSEQTWDFITTDSDINSDYNTLLDTTRNIINAHTSLSTNKKPVKRNQPWITKGLLTSINNKHKLYKKFLKRKVSLTDYNTYKNKLTSLLRVAKQQYFVDFANKHKKDTKSMWSVINACTGKTTLILLHLQM
jgi:hypothetical protein